VSASRPAHGPAAPRPIAIGGVGGSGTRVVAQILIDRGVDLGPDLNRSLDNLWFTLLFSRPAWLPRALDELDDELATGLGLFAAAMEGRLGPSPAQARYLARATLDVARHGHNHLGDGRGRWAVRRARSMLARGRRPRGAATWGWKEPATYLLLDPIRRHLGTVRYVHVLRHGLDMAFSRNQQHLAAFGPRHGIEPGGLGPEASLRYWLAANDRAVEEGRRLFGDGFVLVRFDDLCLDPRATIDRLLSDLGEDPAPGELDRLAELPSAPASMGLHRREDLSRFHPDDVERVRAWGFDIGAASAAPRPRRRRKRPMTLSVALCTFNGAPYLPQQLDSITAQTRPPEELVVCDDGSADATREILAEFASSAPFPVRLHEPEAAPLGPGRNFGRAIAACTGEVIVLCDQDDAWAGDRLQRVEAAFRDAPGLALFFSDADLIDERSRSRQRRLWEALGITPGMWLRFSRGDAAERVRMLCDGNLMTGATLAMRAEWRDLVLPIPEGWIHDAWIGMLLSATADVLMSPERTIRYRLHADQHVGIGVQAFTWAQHALYRAQLVRRMTKRERQAFREISRGLSEARDRLADRADRHPVAPEVLQVLSDKAVHFEARGRMDSLPHRWSLVRSELAAGRYHRYSNGWPSVAKDVLLLDRFGRQP
jgi:glycosyltransferase involved in cell wall biosynthesis